MCRNWCTLYSNMMMWLLLCPWLTSVKYMQTETNWCLALALLNIFFSFIFSTGSDSCFWEFHPSSVILGVFVFFFILIFCESLALYAKSRGFIHACHWALDHFATCMQGHFVVFKFRLSYPSVNYIFMHTLRIA